MAAPIYREEFEERLQDFLIQIGDFIKTTMEIERGRLARSVTLHLQQTFQPQLNSIEAEQHAIREEQSSIREEMRVMREEQGLMREEMRLIREEQIWQRQVLTAITRALHIERL